MRTIEQLKCPECGKFLVNAVRHSTCPDFHGRLHRLLDPEEEAAIKAEALPAVKGGPKKRMHRLDGKPVRSRRNFGVVRAVELAEAGVEGIARCSSYVRGFGQFEPKS